MTENVDAVKNTVARVEITENCLSGRAGITLVSRYLRRIGICRILAGIFSFTKRNSKGTGLQSIFHQIICFFFDGTNFSLSQFDVVKNDHGYASSMETPKSRMISSHSVKRFMQAISLVRVWLFRKVLNRLFLWRLEIEKPKVIKVGIDTMVMDNDDAQKREGVDVTYKNVKGFQPLQMYWGRYLIDAILRNGKAHSNHGNHVKRMVTRIVKLIRENYCPEVPILLVADTGFYDQKLFELADILNISFIVGGRMYEKIQEKITDLPDDCFFEFSKNKKKWMFCEFEDKRESWNNSWRCIYSKPVTDDKGQIIFGFDRPECIMYTNLGKNNAVTFNLLSAYDTTETEISPQAIINAYHERARDELVNRALKDFGTERLPFKRFSANAAYYYLMVISFFIFESFKQDLSCEAVPVSCYASTFRRRCLDIAGKYVRTGRQIIMKLVISTYRYLKFDILWKRSMAAVPIT